MQKSLKNSLYLGLAVLSLGAATVVSTSADAASKAKVSSDVTMKTDATTRNVEATGKNALYSKPGTVKGAKRVASKSTMKKLANSSKSGDYFRAYRVAKTNKGLVYYKVVTMDGKYRGYIYGGKDTSVFAGGITSASTTTKATMPTRTTGFHLTNAKKNGLWTAPKNTQYKAKSVSLYGANSSDTFTVSDAQTKTREGSLYYYVTDNQNKSIAGWIYVGKGYQDASTKTLGGLSVNAAEPDATNDNSVTVVYRTNGAQVGSAKFITTDSTAKAGKAVGTMVNTAKETLDKFAANSVPAGYQLTTDKVSTTNATFGNSLYVDVTAAATSKVSLNVEKVNNGSYSISSPLTTGSLNASEASVTLNAAGIAALSGTKGQVIGDKLATIAAGFSKTFEGTKTYYTTDGTAVHYQFTFTPANFEIDNRNAAFGDTLKASFVATLVPNAATSTSTNNSWIA
ncbi:S-layer protein [Levilactobacillus fuyuanensis]|uniref:S-layer protein n=1 Tax=Levilactobacillus fuyuanensis TaxID=2486022 RepID=A0ABW4H692_9LACO|nr:S-layer protein [Levilactobacillus fuyuanensis]